MQPSWEELHVVALRSLVEMRHVPFVKCLGQDPVVISVAERDPAARRTLDDARAWLSEAEAHEAWHGTLSLLDRQHPKWVEMERRRATFASRAAGVPAS